MGISRGASHRYTFYLDLFMDIRNSAIYRHTFYMVLFMAIL
jgi:hypothetical protein